MAVQQQGQLERLQRELRCCLDAYDEKLQHLLHVNVQQQQQQQKQQQQQQQDMQLLQQHSVDAAAEGTEDSVAGRLPPALSCCC